MDSADRALIGRRVCGEINIGCGECARCRAGLPGHCESRTVLGLIGRDGAFAEYVRLPECNLHVVPDSISDESAVFVEPLAAAFEILEQVTVAPGDRAVVLGDGKLGLLCAQVLARAGAQVELAGHHEERAARAREYDIRWVEESAVRPGGDIVVEATGSASGFERAVSLVRPRGTIVLKSTIASRGAADLNTLVVNEISVIGSRCGPFPRAIRALETGEVAVEWMITARYPLSDGVEALQYAGQRGVLKVLLEPDGRR